jgi:hypothetical protein
MRLILFSSIPPVFQVDSLIFILYLFSKRKK